MRLTQSWLVFGSAIFVASFSGSIFAKDQELLFRIARLEQIVNNKLTNDTFEQIESLQQEVRDLRGRIETINHRLAISNQNQDLSKDNSISYTFDPNILTEDKLYQAAYSLLEKQEYAEAAVSMQDFLWKYPDSKFAANAYYWLAEIYLVKWKEDKNDILILDKSLAAFKIVIDKYPEHHKAVDSLLKLGMISMEKQQWQAASDYFNSLKVKYPDSSRNRIADLKLQELQKQGLL